MKVALVHDWLTGMRGGEKCLAAFLQLYPQADLYTLLHKKDCTSSEIDQAVKGTSWFQRLPNVENYYRKLLPFFPSATNSLKIKGYDLVISTSHAAAKNIYLPKETFHVSYCFTPMRYIWDQADTYLGPLKIPSAPLLAMLRSWDRRGSERVDRFVAISRLVSARIRKFYGRSSTIIYPPVETAWITPCKAGEKGEAFLYAGALVPYKRVDLLVEAFNKLGLPLWIAGSGPEVRKLKTLGKSNIHFFGAVSDRELADLYRRCRALVFPGKEDFGLIPVEVMAAGRPVIALEAGGAKETVHGLRMDKMTGVVEAAATGVFINKSEQNTVEGIVKAVEFFIDREAEFEPENCIRQAKLFSSQRFFQDWNFFIQRCGFPVIVQEENSVLQKVLHA